MKGPEHSSPLSPFGSPKAKVILLGPSGPHFAALISSARSLNIEHVSPGSLVQLEISRRTPLGQKAGQAFAHGFAVSDQLLLAVLRKWFWARKPDAGFLLEGFPATLLQALVFDEWLEARGETLTGGFATVSQSASAVVTHYRTQGLLLGDLRAAA